MKSIFSISIMISLYLPGYDAIAAPQFKVTKMANSLISKACPKIFGHVKLSVIGNGVAAVSLFPELEKELTDAGVSPDGARKLNKAVDAMAAEFYKDPFMKNTAMLIAEAKFSEDQNDQIIMCTVAQGCTLNSAIFGHNPDTRLTALFIEQSGIRLEQVLDTNIAHEFPSDIKGFFVDRIFFISPVESTNDLKGVVASAAWLGQFFRDANQIASERLLFNWVIKNLERKYGPEHQPFDPIFEKYARTRNDEVILDTNLFYLLLVGRKIKAWTLAEQKYVLGIYEKNKAAFQNMGVDLESFVEKSTAGWCCPEFVDG